MTRKTSSKKYGHSAKKYAILFIERIVSEDKIMHTTVHARKRMSQRGISREIVELVLEYGEIQQDKVILGRKDAQRWLAKLQRDMKVIKKILDKGGVVVVADSESVITTYNYKQPRR